MSELNTGKYQAYPEYKDSGVEWLRNIPSDWKVVKLKFSTVLTGEKTLPVNAKYVGMENVSSKNGKYIETVETAPEGISNSFNEGDVLFGKLRPYLAKSWLAAFAGICSSEFLVLRSNLAHPKYLNYFMLTDEFIEQVNSSTYGSKMPRASWDFIGLLPMPVMGYKLSQKIANYLDHETAKIDTLIEKQQQLIKLLKEKRQAVISHAVIKGLNSNAPMKDSGVEWFGEVPEHWVTKSYRYACKIYRGKFGHRPRNDPAFYDGDYPFIQTGDVARASKMISSYSQTLNTKGKEVSQLFPSGTLMMAIAANIGDTAILGFEAYAPDSVVGFKPYADLYIEFLRYSFMAALPALEQTSTQSTQANLNVDRIGAVKAVFPPREEQLEIVQYLDKLLDKYDVIEGECKSAIALMQERRTALISAAVTGKIDVRHWEQPND